MTHVKCAKCKEELPMSELKLDKSGNFLVCSECYDAMQSQINSPRSEHKNSPGFFSRLGSLFAKKKERKYDDEILDLTKTNNKGIQVNEDITGQRKIIIAKDEPLVKRNDKVKKEEKQRYICNKCNYKFKLSRDTRIKSCIYCGNRDISEYKELDADSILRSLSSEK